MGRELRQHRRLDIELPLETALAHAGEPTLRCTTRNISAGGVLFDVNLVNGTPAPEASRMLDVELTIPPGEGHFPYEGLVRSTAEVLRCEPLTSSEPGRRFRVAARFCEPLKLAFA